MNWRATNGTFDTAAALCADLAMALIAMPSIEQLTTDSTNTQPNVTHLSTVAGRSTSNSSVPITSTRAASARLATATRITLPRKYETADMGVPRKRSSVPSSRFNATFTARFTNEVAMMPAPTMLAVNTWDAVTPVPANVLVKIDPNSTRIRIGNAKVKTTCSLARKNCFSSRP